MTPTTTRTATTRTIHQLYVFQSPVLTTPRAAPSAFSGGRGRPSVCALGEPEEVPLDGVDAERSGGVELGLRLDSDSRAGEPEPRGEPDGGDHQAVVDAEVGGQRPVELAAGQGKVSQRRDGEPRRAEVVQRDPDAGIPQGA